RDIASTDATSAGPHVRVDALGQPDDGYRRPGDAPDGHRADVAEADSPRSGTRRLAGPGAPVSRSTQSAPSMARRGRSQAGAYNRGGEKDVGRLVERYGSRPLGTRLGASARCVRSATTRVTVHQPRPQGTTR